MAFAENLRRVLAEMGVAQAQAAELCGVSRASLTEWLGGRAHPRATSVKKLAMGLGVPVADLLDTRLHATTSPAQKCKAHTDFDDRCVDCWRARYEFLLVEFHEQQDLFNDAMRDLVRLRASERTLIHQKICLQEQLESGQ